MALTKKDLVESLSKELCLPKVAARTAVNMVLQEIVDTLAQGEMVKFAGIGTLRVRERKAHYAHNPAGGEKILVPTYKTVVFRCGQNLKDAVNKR